MTIYPYRTTPLRYVYHVAHNSSREYIRKNGLTGCSSEGIGYENAIFAHNTSVPSYHWYPFCFDLLYEYDLSNIEIKDPELDFAWIANLTGYEFWRIDTRKIPNKWYIDHIGMEDFHRICSRPVFIVTFEDIPAEALTLYQMHCEGKVRWNDGVAHVQGFFREAESSY